MILVETLMSDAHKRRAVERGFGLPSEPMSVWTDSDQSWDLTELSPTALPKWEDLTEFMKLFVGFDIGMEFKSGHSFTAHIHPRLANRWKASRTGLMANVEQSLRRTRHTRELQDVAFCYVLETRDRSGQHSTKPHLHGYCVCNDPLEAVEFKAALEEALHPGVARLGTRPAVEVEPSYDYRDEEFIGRAHWVRYFTKNVSRWDALIGRRRVYISRSLVRMIRDAWEIRRGG